MPAVGKPDDSLECPTAQQEIVEVIGKDQAKEALFRPGTPDMGLEHHSSHGSLSEAGSSAFRNGSLHRGLHPDNDTSNNSPLKGTPVDTHPESDGRYKQSGGIAKAGSEQNGAGVAESEAAMQAALATSTPPSHPRLDGLKRVSAASGRHQRNPSAVSVPESDISSSGTFIDKTGDAPASEAGDGVGSGLGIGGDDGGRMAAVEEYSPLKPPESAFSSDMSEQQSGRIPEEDGLQCLTCKVTATSEEQLAMHLEGKKHKRFLAMAELDGSPPPPEDGQAVPSEELHCDLCDVTAPSPHHREYHLRGQKHQRREKQHQLMEASAELATTSVNALLSDHDSAEGGDPRRADGPRDGAGGSGEEGEETDKRPLKSPFEEFRPGEHAPGAPPLGMLGRPLLHHPSHRSVRFNGGLESFSEEPEGAPADVYGPNPPLPPLDSGVSTSSYKLISGGSFSSPAAHYCPVCGIIATSQANLEDHLQGRRHARRLQYLSHMPADERNDHLHRTLTAASSGLFRQGSLVLPSSMDLTAYIGTVAQVQQPGPASNPAAYERGAQLRHAKSLNKTLSNQRLSWDSVNGLHTHLSARGPVGASMGGEGASAEAPGSPGGSAEEPVPRGEGEGVIAHEGPEVPRTLEPQPKCDICGITTTSQAHMEAHKAGRKHKRRMEAAAGRGHVKPSAHYCALCEISTTSSAHLALHLVGRAHRRRQKALDEGESLHPVSLLQPHDFSASADAPEARQGSGGGVEAVSSGDAGTSGQSGPWKPGDPYPHRNGDHAPQPAARSHSQPDFHPQRELRHSRGNSADLGHAGMRSFPMGGRGGHPSPQHAMHPGMPPQMGFNSPVQHAPYPLGMYPYPPQFYSPGAVPPYSPGHGNPPYMAWWPGASPQMSPQRMHPPGQYPMGPRMYPGMGPHMPMMGMQLPGGFPGARPYPPQPPPPPHGMGGYGEAGPSSGPGQQSSGYNCEVCNVQTEQLDDLKQHLRGKQHKRRLYAPSNTARPAGETA